MKKIILFLSLILVNSVFGGGDLESIHAIVKGNPDGPVLLLLHGTPGSHKQYAKLMESKELLDKALLVAVDRPGYGMSYTPASSFTLEDQARVLNNFVQDNYGHKKIILVGFSYGTAVAAKMASLQTGKYQAIYLFAAFADPEVRKEDWLAGTLKNLESLVESRLGRRLIPRYLFSSQKEIKNYEEELRLLLPAWTGIQERIYVIQGERDKSATPHEGEFIKSLRDGLETELTIIKDGKHGLIMENLKETTELLLRELE